MDMQFSVGIIAALVALLAWGFGDFFIQRSIRAIGSYGALFFIGLLGFIVLLPFVWRQLPVLFEPLTFALLMLTLGITFAGAAVLFQALNVGKLSVVEPMLSTELIITLLISALFLKEKMTVAQIVLVACIFAGIMLIAAHREHKLWWQLWKQERVLERGVMLGAIGAFLSSLINTSTALASRGTTPTATIWFVHTGLAVISIGIMGYQGVIRKTFQRARKHWKSVLSQSILDNVAWIAYAKAALTLPVGIAVGISESYIVLSTFLGITISREKLSQHQLWGVGITLIAAIALAVISG